ncbi:hypothetical protein E4526_16370 [Escherichia coli]|nr:hypothetical protein [Escherichia coli]
MINIISDMILCVLLDYHISCWFSAAQIRFLVKSEPTISEYLISQFLYPFAFIIFLVFRSYNAC